MRGASSHDGKLHGNVQQIEAYDKDHGRARKANPKESGGHSGGAHEPSGHDEIKQIVAEHGPAKAHHITRSEDGAGYSSETEHEDGHTHPAEHETLEEAHEHGAHAMDDTDHVPANSDAAHRMNQRNRKEASAGNMDFMENEE